MFSGVGRNLRAPASIRKRTTSDAFIILCGLLMVIFMIAILSQATRVLDQYLFEIIICALVGGLSIYGQLRSLRCQASIHFASFFFCFLFLFAAPVVQMTDNSEAVFHIDHWALWSAVNGLLFTFIGAVAIYRLRAFGDTPPLRPKTRPSNINYLLAFIVSAATAAITIALFHGSLFSSREEFSDAFANIFQDPATAMLARMLLFYTPFFGSIIGLRSALEHRQQFWSLMFLIILSMAAIVNNPIVNPRYQLAGLAFFFIDYMFYGRRTRLLAVLLLVGVLLAPVFQMFRYDDDSQQNSYDNRLFASTLLSMDYDAFPMSCYTMMAVDSAGISWGSNIAGAVLFFVPRAIWPTKPEPTSWVIFDTASHSAELGTDNLSTPLMAEGYFALGWIGSLLIGLLYWGFISRVTLLSRQDPDSWAFLVRCLLAGVVLIFLRGPLTVGVSAAVGSITVAAIPAFLMRYRFGMKRLTITQRSSRASNGRGLYR